MSDAVTKILIESKESMIKAIKDGFEPLEINLRLGYPKGVIRGFNLVEICSEAEINQIKELIITCIQREIDNLKTNPK